MQRKISIIGRLLDNLPQRSQTKRIIPSRRERIAFVSIAEPSHSKTYIVRHPVGYKHFNKAGEWIMLIIGRHRISPFVAD